MKTGKQSGFGVIGVLAILVALGVVGFAGWYVNKARSQPLVKNYQECVNKGYPILLTYPGQCKTPDGKSFTNPADTSNSLNTAGLAILSGVVTQGPTAPVCSTSGGCYSVVSNHTIEAEDSDGKIVTTTKTDSNGKYTLHLKPGHYSLVLVPSIGSGVLKGNEVDVINGTNSLDLSADTGMR
jgi:hypothetical protein